MVEWAVIDASPLILFSRSGHLALLRSFAETLWVPQSVADEINARGDIDPTAMALREHTWLVAKPPTTILSEVLNWRLGAGETSIIALALQHELEAIIDDLGARTVRVCVLP